nr:PREDICTED: cathepsin W-like [Bemisia tabaci]
MARTKARVVQMDPRQRFAVFKSAFRRRYSSKNEENKRFEIFQRNLVTIDKLNAQKKGSAVFGVNIFADYTQEEYMRTRGGKPPRSQSLTPRMFTPRGRKRSNSAPPPGRTNSREPRFPERGGSVPPPYTIGRDRPDPPLKDWRVPAHLYPPTQPQVRNNLHSRLIK